MDRSCCPALPHGILARLTVQWTAAAVLHYRTVFYSAVKSQCLMQRHQRHFIFVCLPSNQYILATDLAPQNKPHRIGESSSNVAPFHAKYATVVCFTRCRCLRRQRILKDMEAFLVACFEAQADRYRAACWNTSSAANGRYLVWCAVFRGIRCAGM